LVSGIDPAEIHPDVAGHPNFRHLKMRGSDVKRREFSGVKWLMTDMNVAPKYTLDTVEGIVNHPDVNVEGMLLTLKLLDWEQADDAAEYVSRVQSWGFAQVHCRQLQNNRREFCLAAERKQAAAAPMANLEKRAARKLAKLTKHSGGTGKATTHAQGAMPTVAAANSLAKERPVAEIRPAKKNKKKGKRSERQSEIEWEENEMESGESRSKRIFAAKKSVPVPVKKSRPEPQAPTKHAKGAHSSAAEAKADAGSGEAKKAPAAAPKMKLGLERKADLNAQQDQRRPVPKVGAKGVKARPRPLTKKKRN
jgi:hypothetical protein